MRLGRSIRRPDQAPGITEAPAGIRVAVPERPSPVTYPLGLDIGEVADGQHLVVRSIALAGQGLLLDFAFAPEAGSKGLWPSLCYGADVSPPG